MNGTASNKTPSVSNLPGARRLCVAPMLDWTDRHCRFFMRLISKHAYLYTEMITTGAILHGDAERALRFHPAEHPLALQLGGCVPAELAACARIAAKYGYDEINLNVGCPSDRVQNGRFGACLMAEPALVADCVAALNAATHLPVTVKTRIGIDDRDSYEFLYAFVAKVAAAGCGSFIIHARKAWLQGLSPKANREVPPLHYDTVYRLKRDFPRLEIIINGGIGNLEQAQRHLLNVDGVMLGRAAYHNPYLLAAAGRLLFNDTDRPPSRQAVIARLLGYIAGELQQGTRLHHITRHIHGLYQGRRGARAWRRYLSEYAHHDDAGLDVIRRALAAAGFPLPE
ncbi:MAG: tRNA dihydrouridine(20/20a) synthase DusA [Gammaproteobacteria bacterium]|jgi:tRNA-dihydrouridine synthase A